MLLFLALLAPPALGRPAAARKGARPAKPAASATVAVAPCWAEGAKGLVDARLKAWRDVPLPEKGLPDDLAAFLRAARAWREGRPGDAATALEAVLKARATPLASEARLLLPEVLLRAGRAKAALTAAGDLLERSPGLPWADAVRVVRAAALGALGDPSGAARALAHLAGDGSDAGRAARVMACLPAGVRVPPSVPPAVGVEAARLAFRRGHWERAVQLFRDLVARPGGSELEREALAVEGRALFRLGLLDEAHRAYAALWHRFRARPGLSWAMKTAFMLGRRAVGLDLARAYQATSHDPAASRLKVVEVLTTFGHYAEALDLYTAHLRALPPKKRKAPPRTADEAWKLGWLLHRTGQHERALAALEASRALSDEKAWPRVRYWLARVREARGDRGRAERDYRAVAAGPDAWYRLLAESRLAEAGPLFQPRCEGARLVAPPADLERLSALPRRSADLPGTHLDDVPSSPEVRAARFLLRHGLPAVARDYVRQLVKRFPLPVKVVKRAIKGSRKAVSKTRKATRPASGLPTALAPLFAALHDEVLLLRTLSPWRASTGTPAPASLESAMLPLAYRAEVLAAARAERLDPFLLWAVALRESGFDERIVSPAGALGLFQVMPETGARLATALDPDAGPFDPGRLFEPGTAVRYGARYLRLLLDRFRDQEPLAVAAYNAGPNYVAAWAAQKPKAPLDAFVEEIPFDENRAYVKRVVGAWASYRAHYESGAAPYLANAIDPRVTEGISY